MPHTIAFTAAQLSGPCIAVETIGHVGDFDFSRWPLLENDSYYWHDGRDFTRILPGRRNPEPGGNFSWLFRQDRWQALLDYEQSRFGAFGPGDMLRINENFFSCPARHQPLSPGWHRDNSAPVLGRPTEADPHMYLIGGAHPELNAELALSRDGLAPAFDDFLGRNAGGSRHEADLTDYFRAHGGTRHIGSGEVVCLPVKQPHRSSPCWGAPHPGRKHEFNRMKVLRAAR